MEQTDYYNPVWKNLVLDKVPIKLNFLAANILLARTKLVINSNSPAYLIEKAEKEIFELYLKHQNLPNAKKDIELLLSKN